MLRNRKAQALLELAILGSLLILAFSYAIDASERYNREQSYMQQTFRAALKQAHKINNSAGWQTVDFRRMPNTNSPMELGTLQQFSSSNNVLWTDGKKIDGKETESKSYLQFNREKEKELPDTPGLYYTTATSYSGYTSKIASETKFNKDESEGKIVTYKSLAPEDEVTYNSSNLGKFSFGLDEGGKYKVGGKGYTRSGPPGGSGR